MDATDADAGVLLTQAIAQAQKLVADLRQQQAEFDQFPQAVSREKLETGASALHNAALAAEAMLNQLLAAAKRAN